MANKASRGNVVRLGVLLGLIALMAIAVFVFWPYFGIAFEEGGMERIVKLVKDSGPLGGLVMVGIQFVQIIVAPIPGEVVEIAAGIIYGPWIGTLLLLIGDIIASAVIFEMVHRLGAPFVQEVVSTKHLNKFREFERSGKLGLTVFILFLLPGMPKDTFTYLLALTEMKMKPFMVLTTVARLPVLFFTIYAAAGISEGNYVGPAVVIVGLVVLSVILLVKREKLMHFLGQIDV